MATKEIIEVTILADNNEDNYFPDFSAVEVFTIEPSLLIPDDIMQKVLNHLEIDCYSDTLTIVGIITKDGDSSQDEEITDVTNIFELKEVLSEDLSTSEFSWGYAAIGYITVHGERIPPYYTQNAAPIGFVVSDKYANLLL